jgi:hypothetical protein
VGSREHTSRESAEPVRVLLLSGLPLEKIALATSTADGRVLPASDGGPDAGPASGEEADKRWSRGCCARSAGGEPEDAVAVFGSGALGTRDATDSVSNGPLFAEAARMSSSESSELDRVATLCT